MLVLIRACGVVAALAIAAPVLAQQGSTASHKTAKQTGISKPFPAEGGVRAGYMKGCGTYFRCYNRIPLECADNTRPYQNIAEHQCLCVRDGCPQNGF